MIRNLWSKGATLLEVMLVLSIASLIVLMSIRYYKAASDAQNATAVLTLISGITAAADSIAAGSTAGYATITTTTDIKNIIGTNNFTLPWGVEPAIGPTAATATMYEIRLPSMPAAVCSAIKTKLTSNPKYTTTATCGAAGNFDYKYTSTS